MSTIWEFIPNAEACERCVDMGGEYDDVPDRPHEHCHCEIRGFPYDERECVTVDIDVEESEEETTPSGTIRHLKIHTFLTCCDGREFDEEFELTWNTSEVSEADANFYLSQQSASWEYGIVQNSCMGLA